MYIFYSNKDKDTDWKVFKSLASKRDQDLDSNNQQMTLIILITMKKYHICSFTLIIVLKI